MAGKSNACTSTWGATAESWARAYIESTSIEDKISPPPRGPISGGEPVRLAGPGRDAGVTVSERAESIPKPGALVRDGARGKLLHVFLHHEVQAAELCAWALLAFADSELPFRQGLLGILDDEVRHARMYHDRMVELGVSFGDHPVRDWFWQRTLTCNTPLQYVALMGLGFEGGNLEHAARFEGALESAGDSASAKLVGQVGREEVSHVHFAARWFTHWTGADEEAGPDFDRWRAELPPPLTPAVLRGRPIDRERRLRAGLSKEFVDALESFEAPKRSPRRLVGDHE